MHLHTQCPATQSWNIFILKQLELNVVSKFVIVSICRQQPKYIMQSTYCHCPQTVYFSIYWAIDRQIDCVYLHVYGLRVMFSPFLCVSVMELCVCQVRALTDRAITVIFPPPVGQSVTTNSKNDDKQCVCAVWTFVALKESSRHELG